MVKLQINEKNEGRGEGVQDPEGVKEDPLFLQITLIYWIQNFKQSIIIFKLKFLKSIIRNSQGTNVHV